MSEQEEKVVEVLVAATPPWWEKPVNAIKIGFATKKALIAAHALFYGVTAATAAGVAGGMTTEEVAVQEKMKETIVTLEEKVVDLQIIIVDLTSVHTDNAHEHAPVEHEHEVVVFPEPVLVPHEHETKDHDHAEVPNHEHEKQICPTPDPIVLEGEHTHKFDPLRGCRSFYE